MIPEQYEAHVEQVLKISAHPLVEDEDETNDRLAESCPSCGSILPTDTGAWDGECPSCHRINEPGEVFY